MPNALDQLDRKINKLNRTVNIAINEREGKRNEGGGGSTVFASSKETTKQLGAALAFQSKIKESQREQLKIQKQANPLLEKQADLQGEIARQVDKIKKNRAGAQTATNLKNQGAQLNRLNFGYTALIRKLNRLRSEYKAVTSEIRGLENASKSAAQQQLIATEQRRQRVNDLRRRKQKGQNLNQARERLLVLLVRPYPG